MPVHPAQICAAVSDDGRSLLLSIRRKREPLRRHGSTYPVPRSDVLLQIPVALVDDEDLDAVMFDELDVAMEGLRDLIAKHQQKVQPAEDAAAGDAGADLVRPPDPIPLTEVGLPPAVVTVLEGAGITDLRPWVGLTADEIDEQPISGLGPARSRAIADALRAWEAGHAGDVDQG